MRHPSPVFGPSPLLVSLFAALLAASGCGSGVRPPGGWSADAEEASRHVYGSWVEVHGKGGAFQETLLGEGEALAISSDTLYVATTDWETIRSWGGEVKRGSRMPGLTPAMTTWADTVHCEVLAIPRDRIVEARLRRYSGGAASSSAGLLVGLGTLSTLSHGYWLLFSLPIWATVGGTLLREEARFPNLEYRAPRAKNDAFAGPDPKSASEWETLRPWTRFPQGLPRGVVRTELRPYLGPDLEGGGGR